jgi:hypothetical protein
MQPDSSNDTSCVLLSFIVLEQIPRLPAEFAVIELARVLPPLYVVELKDNPLIRVDRLVIYLDVMNCVVVIKKKNIVLGEIKHFVFLREVGVDVFVTIDHHEGAVYLAPVEGAIHVWRNVLAV